MEVDGLEDRGLPLSSIVKHDPKVDSVVNASACLLMISSLLLSRYCTTSNRLWIVFYPAILYFGPITLGGSYSLWRVLQFGDLFFRWFLVCQEGDHGCLFPWDFSINIVFGWICSFGNCTIVAVGQSVVCWSLSLDLTRKLGVVSIAFGVDPNWVM